ncbi:hypothetical protein [Nannocystis bainbridge]|uniref:Lipoprotein n=1 Tax=Nannocystis bainbridge TaxID=2995303 RepID=A0ABT5EB14_9BACT|nr:hypothetical protein [Nannocystis bainbridge]MDC0722790.1 hypothetical protein [Nannocystis bainbridge]
MRSLIHYPLSLMFLVFSPACGEKHSLGELTVSAGDPSSSSGDPSSSSADPSGDPSTSTTGELPTTEGNDPCAQHTDEATCVDAGCEFVGGGALEADVDGCHWGDQALGFCASISGGSQSPAIHCDPDGVPVVFSFDPLNIPADWGNCSCEVQGLALDCYRYAINLGPQSCGALTDHCESLTDQASCDQFQGDPGLNGCLWVESTHEVAAEPACSAEPPVGRCIPVHLRQSGGCFDTSPPASCDPAHAGKTPYFGPVGEGVPTGVELELLDDVSCQFEPLDYSPCWADEDSPAGCDCACD